jgi:hypothetical protein
MLPYQKQHSNDDSRVEEPDQAGCDTQVAQVELIVGQAGQVVSLSDQSTWAGLHDGEQHSEASITAYMHWYRVAQSVPCKQTNCTAYRPQCEPECALLTKHNHHDEQRQQNTTEGSGGGQRCLQRTRTRYGRNHYRRV